MIAEPAGPSAAKLRFAAKGATSTFLTRGEILQLWKTDQKFCDAFSQYLAASPFDAYFWETPASLTGSLALPFECVVSSSAALACQQADPTAFTKRIEVGRRDSVVAFANLSGDADLVVPCDTATEADYAQLAAFLRTAPKEQIRLLWAKVASVSDTWLARGRPFWVSTSGLGVPWVHVRIDSRPKYYTHVSYKGV